MKWDCGVLEELNKGQKEVEMVEYSTHVGSSQKIIIKVKKINT